MYTEVFICTYVCKSVYMKDSASCMMWPAMSAACSRMSSRCLFESERALPEEDRTSNAAGSETPKAHISRYIILHPTLSAVPLVEVCFHGETPAVVCVHVVHGSMST